MGPVSATGERVIQAELEARWDPNVETGILAITEAGDARLLLAPFQEDADRRPVAIICHGARAARMEPPN
jgi:hypothetical protein